MKRIAVLTSGGDAPGMNAAIRSVVRTAAALKIETVGVRRGFAGLLAGDMTALDRRHVGGIIQRGGTVLGTARSQEFVTPVGQSRALANLNQFGLDGMVVIGGDGSLRGALQLSDLGFPVIGVPATIDNDIAETELAIGVDTALNTALEAIDRIKDTASAHNRVFIVEVMGREAGYLALAAGLAAGAELVMVPEVDVSLCSILTDIACAYAEGKPHYIIVAAEGSRHKARDLAHFISHTRSEEAFETRLTVLGHVQRGGSPTAFDRIIATRLAAGAVYALRDGLSGHMTGLKGGEIRPVPLREVLAQKRPLDMDLYQLAQALAQ